MLNNILDAPTQPVKVEAVQMLAQDVVQAADKDVLESSIVYQSVVDESVVDKSVVDKSEAEKSAFEENDLMKSTISIDVKSPKQIYFDQVEAECDKKIAYALKSLYEFGFINFAVNKALMVKHGDVNLVAEQLMTGALGESQMHLIGQ